MNLTIQFFLAALVAYLIGAIPTGVIATKLVGAPDVRYHGSRHTGGTNTMRLTNPRVGIIVVFIDGLKGLIAWGAAYLILLGNSWALPIAGAMAVIGHCWPIYTRFHGGMGLATGGGLILVTSPLSLLFIIPLWAFFFLVIFKKTYSPRSVLLSILVGIPLRLWLLPADLYGRWFLIAVGLILVIRHLSDWNRQI